jgi:hypothetical protein
MSGDAAQHEELDERPAANEGADDAFDLDTAKSLKSRAEVIRQELKESGEDEAERGKLAGELEEITAYIRAATGLGGRRRRLGDQDRKLRKSVGQELTRTIKALRKILPELGDHLDRSVCDRSAAAPVYRPGIAAYWKLG